MGPSPTPRGAQGGLRPVAERWVPSGPFRMRCLVADESGGPPVLLLHGFAGWADCVWLPTIEALRDRYTVIAPDLVGFGRSSKPAARYFDVDDPLVPTARSLWVGLDNMGIRKATWVGISLGGGVALRTAIDQPERVERLALVSSMGLGRSIHYAYKAIANPLLGPRLVQPDKERIRRLWLALVNDPSLVTEELVDENYRLLSEPGAAEVLLAARRGVNVVGQRLRFVERLPFIAQDTLVVWGREDRVFPVRHAMRAARLMPRARLEVIENCGHVPPIEQPAAFNRALLRWLDGAPAVAAADGAREVVES